MVKKNLNVSNLMSNVREAAFPLYSTGLVNNCHSPTQPQLELELDLIMGRNPLPTHPTHQELLRHFQTT
jgi:hypothetical protein